MDETPEIGWKGDELTLLLPEERSGRQLARYMAGFAVILLTFLAAVRVWPAVSLLAFALSAVAAHYWRRRHPTAVKVLRFDRASRRFRAGDVVVTLPEHGALLLDAYTRERPRLRQLRGPTSLRLCWIPDVAQLAGREAPGPNRLGVREFASVTHGEPASTVEGAIVLAEARWEPGVAQQPRPSAIPTLAHEVAFALEIPLVDLTGEGPSRVLPTASRDGLAKLMQGEAAPPARAIPRGVTREDTPGLVGLRCRMAPGLPWLALIAVPLIDAAMIRDPLSVVVFTAMSALGLTILMMALADRRVRITSDSVTIWSQALGVQAVPKVTLRYDELTRVTVGGPKGRTLELHSPRGVHAASFRNVEQAEYVRACVLHPPQRETKGYR